MILKIKKLHQDAIVPKYAHFDDAGFDLFAIEDTLVKVGERKAIKTGLAMAIPTGFVGLVWDKSGLSIKEGIKTMGGVIDSTYRGEVMIGGPFFWIDSIIAAGNAREAGLRKAKALVREDRRRRLKEFMWLTAAAIVVAIPFLLIFVVGYFYGRG